jgi:uncharacterized protein
MKIDVHTHIFPPKVVNDRDLFFDHEPAFKALYSSPKARLVPAETLLQSMDQAEIDCSITFGFPWRNDELAERHNDYVLESAAKYSLRLVPMGCVHPLSKNSVREAERVMRAGALGLGELALYEKHHEQTALDRFNELFECCRAYNGVLLVHANEPVGHSYPGKAPSGLDFYYSLARLAGDTPLILAHWGGGLCFYELLKREASEVLSNVYYDTAASPFLYPPDIYSHMARILGKEKILFGSDYPLLTPKRYFDEMAQAGLTGEEIQAIGGENAARIFRLKGVPPVRPL